VRQDVFAPIIERNTVIPASREKRFTTIADGQQKIVFKIYQGESRIAQREHLPGTIEMPCRRAVRTKSASFADSRTTSTGCSSGRADLGHGRAAPAVISIAIPQRRSERRGAPQGTRATQIHPRSGMQTGPRWRGPPLLRAFLGDRGKRCDG